MTVKPTARTGLAAPDVFYFGNLVGETGDGRLMRVGAGDLVAVRRAVGTQNAGITDVADVDRNGRVDPGDVAVVRGNLFTTLAAPATGGDGAADVGAVGGAVGERAGDRRASRGAGGVRIGEVAGGFFLP